MNNIGIIGTGAIGGYCAVRLKQAGFNVHCLLHSDYDYVKNNGLTLITTENTAVAKMNTYRSTNDMPICDVVLIALKTTSNNLLPELLKPIINEKTLVVLLQNGIGMEEELANFIEPQQIVGSAVYLKVARAYPGIIHHYGLQTIDLAPLIPSVNVQSVVDLFKESNFTVHDHEDLQTIRWKKLVGNIPLNGLAVVLKASTKQLCQEDNSLKIILAITKEVITAAQACGATIPDDYYEYTKKILHQHTEVDLHQPSMKNDFDTGKAMELKFIYETPILLAQEHNYPMKLTTMLYGMLKFLDIKNRAN
jgi:2-dehydropantoate 2-reductase